MVEFEESCRVIPLKLIDVTFTVSTNSRTMMLVVRSRSNSTSIGLVVSFTNDVMFKGSAGNISLTEFPFMSRIRVESIAKYDVSGLTNNDSICLIMFRSLLLKTNLICWPFWLGVDPPVKVYDANGSSTFSNVTAAGFNEEEFTTSSKFRISCSELKLMENDIRLGLVISLVKMVTERVLLNAILVSRLISLIAPIVMVRNVVFSSTARPVSSLIFCTW